MTAAEAVRTHDSSGCKRESWKESSQSEEAAASATIIRLIPPCMRFENAPLEANGLAVDVYARAGLLMSFMFLGPVLLDLATEAAEKACVEAGLDSCEHAKIHGFRPSSLLSNMAVTTGLLCSAILPILGAIVDHTPYRKQLGAYSGAILVAITFVQAIVSSQTWFYVAGLQVIAAFTYSCHNTANYAYISDLSSDAGVQAMYNSSFYRILFMSTIVFLILVVIVRFAFNLTDLETARLALILAATIGAILFSLAWTYLFRDRPALNSVPSGMTVVSAGFRKVFRTMRRIRLHFPALAWYMLAVALQAAAAHAIVSLATTYFKEVLEMNSTEIALAFFAVLVCGIPGSKVAEWLSNSNWNPVQSLLLCNTVFGLSCCGAGAFLRTPYDKGMVPVFAICWGVCIGWLGPTEASGYISLIEKGQEAEMMGIYLLLLNVLGWLPPLVFTTINEAGIPMSMGVASMSIFFGIAIIMLMSMGGYDKAMERLMELEARGSQQKLAAVNSADYTDEGRDDGRHIIT